MHLLITRKVNVIIVTFVASITVSVKGFICLSYFLYSLKLSEALMIIECLRFMCQEGVSTEMHALILQGKIWD